MSSQKRSAFTLVELLVVMAIIGILVGLMLAAVGAAITRAAIAASMNNQRELYLAVQMHETKKQRYPGYAYTTPTGVQASWVVPLMPYLGMNDVYDTWVTPGGVNGVVNSVPGIPILLVQGDDQETPGGPWTSIVVNTGIADPAAGSTAPETRAHGLFFDHRAAITNKIYMTTADIRDGANNTILLGENRRAYDWTATGGGTVVLEYLAGFVWDNSVGSASSNWLRFPINQANSASTNGGLIVTTATDYTGARINGPHPGQAVVMFAGGNAKALSNMIDFTVYNKLCTPNGTGLGTSFVSQAPLEMAEFDR